MSEENEERIEEQGQAGADSRQFQEAVTGAAGGAKPFAGPSAPGNGPDAAMHQEHILQYFTYEHLRPGLQEISKPFGELAARLMALPRNPERSVALRKLLESKDAAVRAALAK